MIEFQQVTFSYPDQKEAALADVNLSIQRGQTVLVCGESGSGKSTFLRLINGLVPHFSGGNVHGRILVNGIAPIAAGPAVMSRQVGFVFQDPETQFVMDHVEDELAFGLENAGIPTAEMDKRIVEILVTLEIAHLRKRRLETLSGGEKQKVAIASALILRPSILVLDEPTSQLDAQSAEEIFEILARLKREFGLTILLAEHRLERVLTFCDRMFVLWQDPRRWFYGDPQQALHQTLLAPPMVELAKRLSHEPIPLTDAENQATAQQILKTHPKIKLRKSKDCHHRGDSAYLQIDHLSVHYGNQLILHDLCLRLHQKESLAVIGRNGAGKSTLLRAIMGLVTPSQGQIFIGGKDFNGLPVWQRSQSVAYLPQDPNALLFADTVLEELQVTLHNFQFNMPVADQMRLLEKLGISHHAHDYPRDLSVGERQRVALAAILVTKPKLLMLDEPTRGLDYLAKKKLSDLLSRLKEEGLSLILVTHDVEFLAHIAEWVVWLEEGRIIAEGSPQAVLFNAGVYTPQMLQYFPEQRFLCVEEIMECVGDSTAKN
ncbi:MAG: ABC transporter ATP-binding protein [Anaerolineales bacterium]